MRVKRLIQAAGVLDIAYEFYPTNMSGMYFLNMNSILFSNNEGKRNRNLESIYRCYLVPSMLFGLVVPIQHISHLY